MYINNNVYKMYIYIKNHIVSNFIDASYCKEGDWEFLRLLDETGY